MESEKKLRITTDEMQKAAHEYNEKTYKYDAFISYRHVEPDQSIAKYVQQMIETFKPPKEFYQNGKKQAFRVFRDREELSVKDLSTSIKDALAESRYLIVISSKRTPSSEWCEKEVEIFKNLHGNERIIPVLIEGEPDESFSKPLKELRKEDEEGFQDILAADIRPDAVLKDDFEGYEYLQKNNSQKLKELTRQSKNILKTEKYRIMATILGCSFGDLKQRDKERKNRLILSVSSFLGALFLIFGIFMANAYQRAELARQEAVQSNANILMKTAKDFLKDGDYIKAILVAKEAMKSINADMKSYDALKAEEMSIFNNTIYHSRASTLTSISTKNKLTFMALSSDEKYVAYGLGNNETAIASVENGEVIKKFSGHSQQVKLLDFSKDGKYLASSSFDNTCIIYDLEKNEEKAKLEIEGVPMLTQFSEDGSKLFYIVFVGNTANFYVYNTATWQKEGEFTVNESVRYVDIKSDGSEALIVLESNVENQLTRRSLKDGEILEVIPRLKTERIEGQEYDKAYKAAEYSADGQNMILLTESEIIKVSLEDKSEIFKSEMYINASDTKVMSESENGERIAIKANTQIYIIDGKNGEVINEIYFHNIGMKYFAYDYNTNTVVGFGENGHYSIWKDDIIVRDNLDYGTGVPIEFIFLKDGSRLLANSHEGQTIKIIDLKSRALSQTIPARVISSSNDSSHLLLFDGNDFSVSDDNGETSKKINTDEPPTYGLMSNFRYYKISNDGRYYAFIGMVEDAETKISKRMLKLYDIQNNESRQVALNSLPSSFSFTDDSEQIVLLDNTEGLKVYDTQNLKELKTYDYIKDVSGSGKVVISKDAKILVLNRFSGIASVYNLETNQHIDDIAGEVVNIQKTDDEIKLKGIQNNEIFNWGSKTGISTLEMDEACTQTPLSFNDVNLYNENADMLLMIRNNETDRKCYVVDFSTGRLIMTLDISVKVYSVNGHISPDGKVIVIDRDYYYQFDKENSKDISYITSEIYRLLSEEEVLGEIDKILSGRTLSEEEKVQIGISTK